MKTGYKTTEFWVSLVGILAAFLVSQGVFTEDQVAQIIGYVGQILIPLGYTYSRSVVKAGPNEK